MGFLKILHYILSLLMACVIDELFTLITSYVKHEILTSMPPKISPSRSATGCCWLALLLTGCAAGVGAG